MREGYKPTKKGVTTVKSAKKNALATPLKRPQAPAAESTQSEAASTPAPQKQSSNKPSVSLPEVSRVSHFTSK